MLGTGVDRLHPSLVQVSQAKGRPHPCRLSKEGIIGETGIIIKGTADSYAKGKIRFRISLLGADRWLCFAEEHLTVGDSAIVEDIEGQILKVRKI